MAQLGDTEIDGHLRITGKAHGGSVMAESVSDYGNTSSPIKAGWSGSSLESVTYLAGYQSSSAGVLIKDIHYTNVGVGYAANIGHPSAHPQIGSNTKPVWVNSNGDVKESVASYGSSTRMMYLSSGTFTSSTANVGDSTHPVYLSNGSFAQCSMTLNNYTGYTFENNMNFSDTIQLNTDDWVTVYTLSHASGKDRLLFATIANYLNGSNSLINVRYVGYRNNVLGTIGPLAMPKMGSVSICTCMPESWHSAGGSGWVNIIMQVCRSSGSPSMRVMAFGTTLLLRNS
jgi:hypothetical protein